MSPTADTTGWVARAVVLAAGKGTRLGALTADRPKPMIPIRGVPVLEHILVGLASVGIREILLIVGYRREAIERHFQGGGRWGVRIDYAVQEVLNGTGGALKLARSFASGGPFLSSWGDILTDYRHYRALVDDYEARPCAAVLGINPVDDPSAGGAVYREGNRVVKVVEKPPPGAASSKWNLAGVNILGPEIFDALYSIAPSPRGELELADAIMRLIESGREVRAVEMRGFWSDIGTPEALAAAEREWGRESG